MKKTEVLEVINKLYTALNSAKDHLEYCGYGDSWERECAEGLEDQIIQALCISDEFKDNIK